MTPDFSSKRFSIAVCIATTGRRELVGEVIRDLTRQQLLPDHVFVCPAQASDVEDDIASHVPYPVTILSSPRGLTKQRNAILPHASQFGIIVFIDDDFVLHPSYLAQAVELFRDMPEVSVATGQIVADGIHNAGYSVDEARALLNATVATSTPLVEDTYGGYGCNMCFRSSSVLRTKATFDERLPLYGWQEDIDFSRQVACVGRVVHSDALLGVHLGVKSGRQSGLRFGYSQISNPVYLWSKGTMSFRYASRLMLGNVVANVAKAFAAEPHIDRRGRVKGNLLATADLIRGRMKPERILDL